MTVTCRIRVKFEVRLGLGLALVAPEGYNLMGEAASQREAWAVWLVVVEDEQGGWAN